MNIVGDLCKELLSMFVADATLALATLVLVAVVAGLVGAAGVGPVIGGGVLLFGSLVILVEAVSREAKGQDRQ